MPNVGAISVWSALVVRGAVERVLLPEFTKQTGIPVIPVFEPTTILMEKLLVEEPPDLIISTTNSLTAPSPRGIDPRTAVPLVRTGIGVGVVAGSPRPSIGTEAELVATLLNARSVAYSRSGQSGIRFVELLERLGISERVLPNATALDAGFSGEAVVDGRADIAIQQISELRYVPGVDVVGPLPEECQRYTSFACALALPTDARRRAKAESLLTFLKSGTADQVYRDEGLIVPESGLGADSGDI